MKHQCRNDRKNRYCPAHCFPFSFAYEKGLPVSPGKPFISLFFYSLSNAV